MVSKKVDIAKKAELALKSAIRRLIAERKKTGEPLVVWRNGKVIKISPHKL